MQKRRGGLQKSCEEVVKSVFSFFFLSFLCSSILKGEDRYNESKQKNITVRPFLSPIRRIGLDLASKALVGFPERLKVMFQVLLAGLEITKSRRR